MRERERERVNNRTSDVVLLVLQAKRGGGEREEQGRE